MTPPCGVFIYRLLVINACIMESVRGIPVPQSRHGSLVPALLGHPQG